MSNDKSVALTAEIISAFLSANSVAAAEVATLFGPVHAALTVSKASEAVPAVPVARSIQPEYLICLDDGKRFKSMRRHLRELGLTPAQYRMKWNLPADYPMVAPNYSGKRSELAKAHGLGRKRGAEDHH